ncbi:MAG: hypothetical protein BRC29_00155 [Nanohaloarchaea archaeon SW_7_43_1]|nr:MAG: hypothetical protein BRC29_00155 [Nanohaloarchaea archaeon SW_7_43_1]
METVRVEAGGKVFEADLADSFLSRVKGLSFSSEGKILFSFSGSTRSRIDMMFLSKPLNLYFMNSDKKVIEVQRAKPWSWNPRTWSLYYPGQKYSYLLESFENLGIEEGDQIEF